LHAALLAELGGIVLALGLLGRLAGRYGQSPIPLYLLAGLAFGHGGLLPLSASEEFIATGAEIGVVLLLVMLGLEYTAAELLTSLRTHYAAGAADFVLNALPGAAAALLLGWGPVAAVALAGVTWVYVEPIAGRLTASLRRSRDPRCRMYDKYYVSGGDDAAQQQGPGNDPGSTARAAWPARGRRG
jgi:CPA2 family monovalent cation:H+ antiporter-2